MSFRLPSGGRLIERDRPVSLTLDGRTLHGFHGDTLASALLANGIVLAGRSFKYHRPRGVMASGVDEPNALVTLGTGDRLEPNLQATRVAIHQGMVASSQNCWPSPRFDLGAAASLFAGMLPAGFYYKTFMWPRSWWKHVYEPLIRRMAGLGQAPAADARDPDRYEHFHAFADALVIGGGVAGLIAALGAARAGKQVLLLEQTGHWGGRTAVDGGTIGGGEAAAFVADCLDELGQMRHVRLRQGCTALGMYDHGYVVAAEHLPHDTHGVGVLRQRLWRIRAHQVILATGALERPLVFPDNDRPGIMLAAAMRDYLVNHAVAAGRRVIVATNNDDAYRTAIALDRAGVEVPVICDTRTHPGPLAARCEQLGIRVATTCGVVGTRGRQRIKEVGIAPIGDGDRAHRVEWIACDALAMSGGWSPAVHLWSHPGGKLLWDESRALFRPDHEQPPIGADGRALAAAAGAANGALTLVQTLEDAARVGTCFAGTGETTTPAPRTDEPDEAPPGAHWPGANGLPDHQVARSFVDFQNDVKLSDIALAAREGFASAELAKRYTTLGMATDQGRTSNVNGHLALAAATGKTSSAVGTTTFRPPFTPVSMGTIAGAGRRELFDPVRETPMHAWHAAHGAYWEPVGQWHRPYAYPRPGEDVAAAVQREVRNTRMHAGLLDASTLGKILVSGPDAGRFLDMIYTGRMSTLAPGRCRYGLMCNENGFLMDDGVVVRLNDTTFLCHTTTGGAERVYQHLEEWHQCEWWDWRLFIANVTEQFAQVGIAGPRAREILQPLCSSDIGDPALPPLGSMHADVAGTPARVFRISFSGEQSFEIAVPASRGQHVWEQLMQSGTALGLAPYGTEALHIMRAEKGLIMIGDETDGTVIPQDLGLDWAIANKKPDYIGKRAQMRQHLAAPDRWRLVGLETLDGSVLPDGAHAVGEGRNCHGQCRAQGRVTSSYYSPTLDRGIALGLVQGGPERMGEVLAFTAGQQQKHGRSIATIPARIVPPVFLDPEGRRQSG